MKKIFLLFAAVGLMISSTLSAQSAKDKGFEILTDNFLQAQLKFLSSDFMEGRGTLDKGGRLSAEYMASILEMNGVLPAGDMTRAGRSYLQTVPFTKVGAVKSNVLKITSNNKTEIYTGSVDFFYNPTRPVELKGEIVFAGYGLIDESIKHNDFKNADVKNKVVVLYNGYPTGGDLQEYFTKNRTANLRAAKQRGDQFMRENGALAILYINSYSSFISTVSTTAENARMYPRETISPNRSRLLSPLSYTATTPAINLSPRVAQNILAGSNINIEKYINDAKNGKVSTPQALDVVAHYSADVELTNVVAHNVVGMIKGKDASKTVVIGGHYDHMGINGRFIWNGADDNASGSVGVLATAAAFNATGEVPECNIIFALWTAEELGLLGSRHFVENRKELYPDTEIISNLNLDMISRSYSATEFDNKFVHDYSDTNPEYKKYTQDNIRKYKLNLEPEYSALDENAFGATDFTPFKRVGIPIIGFFTGIHPDYHRHTDEIGKLDWEKFYRLSRLAFLDAYDIVKNSK